MVCGRCDAPVEVVDNKIVYQGINCYWEGHKIEDFMTEEEHDELIRKETYG